MSAQLGTTYQDDSRAYAVIGPVYHRFDVALSYTKNRRRANMTWKMDIQNIADHTNVVDVEYDPVLGLTEDRNGQILPVFSYKVEF